MATTDNGIDQHLSPSAKDLEASARNYWDPDKVQAAYDLRKQFGNDLQHNRSGAGFTEVVYLVPHHVMCADTLSCKDPDIFFPWYRTMFSWMMDDDMWFHNIDALRPVCPPCEESISRRKHETQGPQVDNIAHHHYHPDTTPDTPPRISFGPFHSYDMPTADAPIECHTCDAVIYWPLSQKGLDYIAQHLPPTAEHGSPTLHLLDFAVEQDDLMEYHDIFCSNPWATGDDQITIVNRINH